MLISVQMIYSELHLLWTSFTIAPAFVAPHNTLWPNWLFLKRFCSAVTCTPCLSPLNVGRTVASFGYQPTIYKFNAYCYLCSGSRMISVPRWDSAAFPRHAANHLYLNTSIYRGIQFFFFSERKKGPLLMRLERKSPADKWWWTESPSLHIRKICLDVCDRWPCWSRGGGPDDLQGSLPPSTLLWFYDTATEQRDRPKIQHLTSSTIHLHSFSLQKFPHSTFINNFTGNYLYFYIPGTIIFAAQSPT